MLEKLNIKPKILYFFVVTFICFLFSLNFFLSSKDNFKKILYRNYMYLNQVYEIFSFYQRNRSILKILEKDLDINDILSSLKIDVIDTSLLYSKKINPYLEEQKYKIRFKTQNLNNISKLLDILKNKYFVSLSKLKISRLRDNIYVVSLEIKKYKTKKWGRKLPH